MTINKTEIIEEISNPSELLQIIEQVISSINIKIIKSNYPFIEGSIESEIGVQNILFIITNEYLSKNSELYNELTENIKKKTNSKAYNSIIIVSNKNITEGFKERLKHNFRNLNISFWNKDELIKRIDDYYTDFWRHNDQRLIAYEKKFEEEIKDDWAIKKVKQFKSAHEKLLDIFISPRLFHKIHDFDAKNKKTHVKISLDKIVDLNKPVIIQGEPGVGKTRILKEIGHQFIAANSKKSSERFLPIFINNIDLIESRSNPTDLVNICTAVEKKIQSYFPNFNLSEISENYTIVFLIDSIDDFNKENQEQIFKDLKLYCTDKTRIYIATRFQDFTIINDVLGLGKADEIFIEKFNETQVRGFVRMYFQNDDNKANNLLTSLQENSIIQRLPITPLNLSLISILFEENNFEIPATITDIYDNFNNLLLGRSLPDTKFAFFDINIREKILSVYALELLDKGERSYMTVSEFHEFFKIYFKPIEKTINVQLLPEALDFIINNTGILTIQDGKYVKFLHESYMEYYASREIFNSNRELEGKLIEKFFDINWQYTAIFYAGRSKSMPEFLNKVIEKTNKCLTNQENYRSVHGLGYLIQALYLTDDSIRKEAVHSGLRNVLEIYEWMKKMSSDDRLFFKSLSLPLSVILNSFFFFDNFNSVTIKGPLLLAFDELFPKLILKDDNNNDLIDANIGFKLFTLALTLASPRIGIIDNMKKLVYETPLLNDPLFERLLDFGVSVAGNKDLYDIKEDLKRPNKKIQSKNEVLNFNRASEQLYLTAPVGRLRFSVYDRIYPDRKYLLLTEGKTDAQIIEHAFSILTGNSPYWEVNPVHETDGGANALSKALSNIESVINDKKVIGIFDNDDKGNQEFNGLPKSKFEIYNDTNRLKKHLTTNIFGLKLPIPPDREIYKQEKQIFCFFSIEHYFTDELLNSQNLFEKTPIPGVFQIKEKRKNEFSKYVRTLDDIEIFKNFIYLFKQIDEIFEVEEIEYKV